MMDTWKRFWQDEKLKGELGLCEPRVVDSLINYNSMKNVFKWANT